MLNVVIIWLLLIRGLRWGSYVELSIRALSFFKYIVLSFLLERQLLALEVFGRNFPSLNNVLQLLIGEIFRVNFLRFLFIGRNLALFVEGLLIIIRISLRAFLNEVLLLSFLLLQLLLFVRVLIGFVVFWGEELLSCLILTPELELTLDLFNFIFNKR